MLHQLMLLLLKLLPQRKLPQLKWRHQQLRKLLPPNPLLQKPSLKHQQPRPRLSQKPSQKLSLKPNLPLLKKKLQQKRKRSLRKNPKPQLRKKRHQSLLASRSTRTHVPT